MLSTIIVLILILTNFVMAFSIGLAGKFHKNIILENTLPNEALEDKDVHQLAKRYRQILYLEALLFSIVDLTILFSSYESLTMTLFWLWLLLPMAAFYATEIHFIRKMAQLKAAKGWHISLQPTLIDTKIVQHKNQKMLNSFWLLPSSVLSIALLIWVLVTKQDGKGVIIFSLLLCWLVAIGLWFMIKRLPASLPTNDSKINQQYNDLTKHHWSMIVIGFASCIPFFFIAPLLLANLTGKVAGVLAVLFFLCLFVAIFLSIWYLLALRKKQDELLSQRADLRYGGEDQYWRYGIYINPNDHRLMIPNRIGLNIGMNFGRPIAKVIAAILGLLILVVIGVSIIPSYIWDFTKDPFQAELTNQEVVLSAPFMATSKIELATITKAELINKIEGNIVRTNGYGGVNYQSGHFKVDQQKATFYLDKASRPILHLVTKERDYYFTFKDSQQTKAFYDLLQPKLE